MNIKKIPLTNDQKLVLSGLISLLVSTMATSANAADQYYTSHASVNVGTLIITFITVFGASFGASLYSYVPSHITQEMQALEDTIAELKAQSAAPSTATRVPHSVPSSPLVVIHTTQASTSSVASVETPMDVAANVTAVLPVSDTIKAVEESVNAASVVNTPEDAEQVTQKVAVVNPAQVSG